jgi:hypothetical protein
MSLATYEEARPWARAIAEELLEGRMPPWPAVKGYGRFQNAPSLTPREIDMVVSWAEGGVPRGEEKDLPAGPLVPSGWALGPPDRVLEASASIPVRAEAEERFDLLLPTGLKEAAWLAAIDLQPGEASLVHCATFWLDGPSPELLGTWVPGQVPVRLPADVGRRLPAGSRLRVRLHYRGAAPGLTDQSRVGLYFARRPPSRVLREQVVDGTVGGASGDGLRRVQGSLELAEETEALALVPRADPSLVSLEVAAYRPDGSTETLLWTRRSSSDAEPTYFFKDPVRLPKATRLVVTAYSERTVDALPLCRVLAVSGRAPIVKETVTGSASPRANWLQIR